MYIGWFSLSGLMAIVYLYFEFKIALTMTKNITTGQEVSLPGKRYHYIVGAAIVSFVGITAFYLGIVAYVGGPVEIICFAPGLMVAAVNTAVTAARLKYINFNSDHQL